MVLHWQDQCTAAQGSGTKNGHGLKEDLAKKKKKVTVYPDQFLNLVYCIPVGAIRSYKGEIAARGEPETGVGEQ